MNDVIVQDTRQGLLQRLKAFLEKGLWPYTADPAPIGLITWGRPDRDQPIWLSGNSRHGLHRLRRRTEEMGLRVAVIDTGGLMLAELADRQLQMADLAGALDQIAPEARPGIALLPYPVWLALGEADYYSDKGWAIMAGPADARDLPTFWESENRLREWQRSRPSRSERLQVVVAHALPIALLILLPLLWLNPALAFVGALIIAASMMSAFLAAEVGGADRLLTRIALAAGLSGALAAAGSLFAIRLGYLPASWPAFLPALPGVLLATWLSVLLTRARQ